MREEEKIRDKARNWTRLNEQRRDQINNPDETRKKRDEMQQERRSVETNLKSRDQKILN